MKSFLLNPRISARVLLLGLLAAFLFILGLARAETVLWSDNFDDGNANNRWYADNGVWQIGSPTTGPQVNAVGGRAFSGTNCATTGLKGNYLSYQDSRLIRIAPFVVPSADQFPRLRFWQWFSFAGSVNGDGGSYGWVQIKAGTNAWQALPLWPGAPLSATYNSSSSGVWSRPSIDLTPFAGQTVQIAFTFHSGYATAPGWYVDDVAVVTGAPVFNNPEGFELGLGDWSVDHGTWEVGKPSNGGAAYDGTNCAGTVLAGNYAGYVDSALISPPFTVPTSNSYPRLRFWHWFSFAGSVNGDGGSYGWVQIKAGTNAWQALPLWPGASPSATYNSSSSGVWSRPSIDLTPFAGQAVQIAFTFHSGYATALGWYVDDVAVVTGAPIFNNPESFEQGLGDWFVDSGTWQVGKTSKGGGAYDGTNCAATVLTGNYASYSSSDFISPPFAVPVCSPFLRFWQWFSFGGSVNGDGGTYGQVYIKAGTNSWQPISQKYTGQSGAWTEPYFDLTPYAGQTAQLDFYFHSAYATAPGWCVDDISIEGSGGSLQVFISPGDAVVAGAQWQVDNGPWQTNGATVSCLSTGDQTNHIVRFSTISDWTTPASTNISVAVNSNVTATGTYVPVPQTGCLQVTISPPGAVAAGAQWQVDGGTWQSSGATVCGLSAGSHTVCFSTLSDWYTPACASVSIVANSTSVATGTYVPHTGSLQVCITPLAAVSAGAEWQVDGGAWQPSCATNYGLSVGPHTVCFKPVPGWTNAACESVTIIWNQTTTTNGTYVAVPSVTHPADTNSDFRITIDEVTAYGACWKQGCAWPSPPNPIPIDYVTRAGYLWRNGECYSYEASNSAPLCWVSTPCPGAGVVADRDGKKAPPVSRAASPKEAGDSVVSRTVSNGVVSLQTSPGPEASVYAVEESLPAGLTPYAISDGGAWDSVNHKIKWGLFFDNTARTLSYKLGGVAGVHPLSGVGSFDGQSIPVSGVMSLDLESGLRLVPGGAALSGGGFQFTFPTESGRTYYVEYAGSLSSNNWQAVAGPLSGTGQPVTWKDAGSTAGGSPGSRGARYYRVRSEP